MLNYMHIPLNMQCITQEQLGVISQVGKIVGEPSTRADAMALLGIAGKMVLRSRQSEVDMLAVSVPMDNMNGGEKCQNA